MDKYERMLVRTASEWQAIGRTKGIRLCCPGCGETRPYGFEVHHIAGQKYGDDALPLCVICHRELSAWQASEHPPATEGAPNKFQKAGMFLIGMADIRDLQNDRMREIAADLIDLGQGRGRFYKE